MQVLYGQAEQSPILTNPPRENVSTSCREQPSTALGLARTESSEFSNCPPPPLLVFAGRWKRNSSFSSPNLEDERPYLSPSLTIAQDYCCPRGEGGPHMDTKKGTGSTRQFSFASWLPQQENAQHGQIQRPRCRVSQFSSGAQAPMSFLRKASS